MPDSAVHIPVVCSLCGTRSYAKPQHIGKQLVCPDCDTLNVVQPPPEKPAPKQPLVDDDDDDFYKLADEDQPNQTDKPELVSLTCTVCHSLIHARSTDTGKRVRCPDCDTLNVVPRRPATKPSKPIDLQNVASLGAGDDMRKQSAARILERAHSQVDEEETRREQDLEPANIPLTQGILTFPFNLNILPVWIGLSMSTAILAFLTLGVIAAMDTGTYAMIYAAFLVAIAAFVLLISLAVWTPKLISIIEETSYGLKTIEPPPSADLASGVMAAIQISVVVAFSSIVGIAVTFLLPDAGPIKLLSYLPTVFLFPICLLSVSEADSLLLPVSQTILTSLSKSFGNWLVFWLTTSLFLAVALIGSYGAYLLHPAAGVVFLAIAGSFGAVIYCRLLGRLSYRLGEDLQASKSKTESDADEDE